MTTKPGDIEAVDEVLGWDPRGDAEEYELLEKAQEAFSRIKRELRELRKSRKESVEKYDELFRMTEGYIKRLHDAERERDELKPHADPNMVALRTPEGEYLRATGSDWGPDYLTGSFSEAVLFAEGDEWGLRNAERAWGGKLTRVPVRETNLREAP